MWTIFKVFTEFVTILLLFYVLVFWSWGRCGLSSLTRDQTCSLCVERWNLNHWSNRKFPYSVSKRKETLTSATAHVRLKDTAKWMSLSQKDKYCMIPLTWGTWVSQVELVVKNLSANAGDIRDISHQSEWLRSKSLQVINAGEGVEKREPSYTVGGNAN